MKISAERKALSDVLGFVTTVVNPRHTNPMVQYVLFDVGEHLTIRATDLEVTLQYTMKEAAAEKKGKALLPAVKLANLIRDGRAEQFTIEKTGDNVVLKCGRDRFTMTTAAADGFPAFPEFNKDNAMELDAKALGLRLHRTGKSIATEKGRYALNGVLLTPRDKMIEVCGTDGRRLSHTQMAGKGREYKFPVILPRRGIDLFTKLLDDAAEGASASLDVRENEIVAAIGDAVISSSLVDGQFPDYWSVVPKANDKKMVANRQELLNAVKLASHMTSIESATLKMTLEGQQLTLATKSSGTGSAEVNVPVTYDGPDMKIGFDPRYVTEGLSLFTREEVVFEIRDGNTGVVVHEGDKQDFYFLMMPVEV
jgi:DNA polymerase-3 subunit beta